MKKYKYACLELRMRLKNNMVAQVKIPFSCKRDAQDYLVAHYDKKFHSRGWIE